VAAATDEVGPNAGTPVGASLGTRVRQNLSDLEATPGMTFGPPVPRILLIDDNQQLLDLVAHILARSGYHVLTAANGAAGLQLWRERGADLVITDIHLAGITGIEVLREIRSSVPAMPAILMSGEPRAAMLASLGGTVAPESVAILDKPFSRASLLATVAAQLGRGPDRSSQVER
jgi:CheY-like chemotaxis protein